MYRGVIIEESLSHRTPLQQLNITAQKIEKVTKKHETPWLEQWTLDTVEIPATKIETVAQDLSKAIDLSHCGNWYCDFKNADWHYVIFYNKVFKLDRKSQSDYKTMQEYAKSIGLPKHQMPTYAAIDTAILAKFLIEAKRKTYANSNATKVAPSRKGSNDYHYECVLEGQKMAYHDCYFGGTQFMGGEIVYCEDKPIWGMNYRGETLDDKLSEAVVDFILRPALSAVGEDDSVLPIRGPKQLKQNGYLYEFQSTGDLDSFHGAEQISKDGTLIYRLDCHGGMIE